MVSIEDDKQNDDDDNNQSDYEEWCDDDCDNVNGDHDGVQEDGDDIVNQDDMMSHLCDDENLEETMEEIVEMDSCSSFKIVIDNIDKHVKPRHMRLNNQARSLNYINSYAVKDRIDSSSLSSFKNSFDQIVNFENILPSKETHQQLKKNVTVIISRILVKHMDAFKFYFEDATERHIIHEHSKEMSRKSEVVCVLA
jgi:hypothetical protein